MEKPFVHLLPYQPDPTDLFGFIRSMPWAQLLDSSNCGGQRGRFDIFSADPFLKIITRDLTTLVTDRAGNSTDSGTDPFQVVKQQLQAFTLSCDDLPFCGGAIGFFGYDLGTPDAISEDHRAKIIDFPDMAIGIYDWAIITDHEKQKTRFVSAGIDHSSETILGNILEYLKPGQDQQITGDLHPLQVNKLEADIDKASYILGFERIQSYLLEGDCYQINYARCFYAQASGSSWISYKNLRNQNPMPFAAYLEYPFGEVLCASPERFIQVTGNKVESRPIKGTRPRSADPIEDERLKNALTQSIKDRAENLMIVDLLRNDLGKSCITGSIHVPELFSIESYPTVFHMVSSIQGTIASDKSSVDVLNNCFPGGSITGAPKKRAMQIISELENHRRGVYCGAIGYISFNGNMDTNIAIRTMTVSNNQLAFWAGGGIVADSNVDEEFQETLDKARAFFDLLGISG